MPTKPKKNQPETPDVFQFRDSFQTPAYGTELLIPFIPKRINKIWEVASGKLRMSKVFENNGYEVYSTDLITGTNFLEVKELPYDKDELDNIAIVTNPPYSLKKKFYEKCKKFNIPFALLIPADYSQWIIDAIRFDNAEKVIPNRRIDYLTPFLTDVVYRGQLLELINKEEKTKNKKVTDVPESIVNKYKDSITRYETEDDIPNELIAKYTASQFHSMYLTRGFELGRTETFVELTKEMKLNIK
jgi:hypothetical protein